MGDTVKAKKQKKNWFKGLKAEFSKIIWPDRQSLTKIGRASCRERV